MNIEAMARTHWWMRVQAAEMSDEHRDILAGAGDEKAQAASVRIEAAWDAARDAEVRSMRFALDGSEGRASRQSLRIEALRAAAAIVAADRHNWARPATPDTAEPITIHLADTFLTWLETGHAQKA